MFELFKIRQNAALEFSAEQKKFKFDVVVNIRLECIHTLQTKRLSHMVTSINFSLRHMWSLEDCGYFKRASLDLSLKIWNILTNYYRNNEFAQLLK